MQKKKNKNQIMKKLKEISYNYNNYYKKGFFPTERVAKAQKRKVSTPCFFIIII